MSLTSTYVQAVDGLYYKDPVFRGTEPRRWFICFDDDDPPELVVERASAGTATPVAEARTIIAAAGIQGSMSRRSCGGQRCFGKPRTENRYGDADSFFFSMTAPIPVPVEHCGAGTTWSGCLEKTWVGDRRPE